MSKPSQSNLKSASHLKPAWAAGELSRVLDTVKRVVIKIGTRVIDDETTHFNQPVMQSLIREIAEFKQRGLEVLLVSSGAVGMGLRTLSVAQRPKSVHLRQAYAAVGQSQLMNVYNELFKSYGIQTAQVLLTRTDLDRRESYLNAQQALNHLLSMGILPIINENDTVSINELQFGDNDILASLVAGKMNAQMLILLTTVDGLYQSFNPKSKSGELIETIDGNWDEMLANVKPSRDTFSMGGMESKVQAGRAACAKGVLTVIANGLRENILSDLFSGQAPATWMIPSQKRMAAWKYYLAFAKRPSGGKIVVDEGAAKAVKSEGRSLLASGVISATGTFDSKALVSIVDRAGNEIARGLSNYSSDQLRKIQGCSSREIAQLLNHQKGKAVVHRDHMVVL